MKCGTCKMDMLAMVVHALLREIPPETIVATYLDGNPPYTADAMLGELEKGSDTGLTYASDLLRISRDFLARQAKAE